MRKFIGFLLVLAGIGAYLYYVQGWDLAKVRRVPGIGAMLQPDASATATPIGSRGEGTHWETLAPMPQARVDFGAATIGDTIYVVGGVDGYLRTLDSLEAYDIATDAWRELAPLPQPIHHPAVATDGKKLYVLGGLTGLAARPLDSAFAYDPQTGAWQELGHLNDFRGGAAAAVSQRLYVMAGRTNAGIDDALEYYDFDHGNWNGRMPVPTARTQLQAVAVGGKIYAIGGDKGSLATDLGTTEAYDPAIDAWKSLPSMAVARSAFAAAESGGRIYAFGGERKGGVIDTVEVFDPAKGSWSTLGLAMPDPRHGLAAASWKNRIYVLGGGRRSGWSVTDLNTALILEDAKK